MGSLSSNVPSRSCHFSPASIKNIPNFLLFESFSDDNFFPFCVKFPAFVPTFPNMSIRFFLYDLTITAIIETSHGFKHSVTMSTKAIQTEIIYFVQIPGSLNALNLAIRSSILPMVHHHVLKASSPTLNENKLFRHQFPIWCITESAFLDTWRNDLKDFSITNFGLPSNCFPCENNGRSSDHIFSDFVQNISIMFSEWVKFCICRRVETCWLNSESTAKLQLVDSTAHYEKFKNLLLNGYTENDALREMKFSSAPPTGKENSSHLQAVCESQNMGTFKDFSRWYKNKDVVPTPDAVQK